MQVRARRHVGQRAFHGGAHAVLVDVAHVEDVDTGLVHQLLFALVHAADADLAQVARAQRRVRGGEAAQTHQLGRAVAAQAGHGHAVQVAAGGERGGIEVGMRVEPQHAQGHAPVGAMARHGADAAHSQTVVAAHHHGHAACVQLGQHGVVHGTVPFNDFGQVAKAVDGWLPRVGRPGQVADVVHRQAQRGQRFGNAGHAQRLGAHAGATRAGADVGGGADQRNGMGG